MKGAWMRPAVGVFLLGLQCIGCCSSPDGPEVGAIVDLHTTEFASHGTHRPVFAKADDGTIYLFWGARPSESRPNVSGVASIPPELTRGSWAGPPTALGVSVYRDGKWLTPSILTAGDAECAPRFAWCRGHTLNVIAAMGDAGAGHLTYDTETREWQSRLLPRPPAYTLFYHGCFESGGCVHVAGFSEESLYYVRFDGSEWADPVVICKEVHFDGLHGYYRPRLAVSDGGDVHVAWNTQTLPRHVVIRGGRVASNQDLIVTYPVSAGNDLDIAPLRQGAMLLSYRPAEGGSLPPGAICVMEYRPGAGWTEARVLAERTGRGAGLPQLATNGDKAILSWNSRTRHSSGGWGAVGPIAGYMVRNAGGDWSDMATFVPSEMALGTIPPLSKAPQAYYSVWCDRSGEVHLAWGNGRDTYYMYCGKLLEIP